jgi:hypothetical protein
MKRGTRSSRFFSLFSAEQIVKINQLNTVGKL